ncbi:MAG: hypothetical protein WBJ48_03135, partial [Bacteroidales bacterium]
YIRMLHNLLTKNQVMSLPQTPSFQHNKLTLIKILSRLIRPSHTKAGRKIRINEENSDKICK